MTLLDEAKERASAYLASLPERRAAPTPDALAQLARLGGPLPEAGEDPSAVLALLDEVGSPGTAANAGGRYFGFVQGGALPVAVAAGWLASGWNQNAGLRVMSPVGAELEDVALSWVRDLLGLESAAGGGLVTGATMANFAGLAAARHALLARTGWDVEGRGLFEAPPISVVAGEEVHVSLLKPLALLGLGRDRVTRVAVDSQGRIRADALPRLGTRTIVCIQAGNVNTGAFDPAREICAAAQAAGAWVHVDGAFGLWARAAPAYAPLAAGYEEADSWATDAHKWPNAGYDCGIVLVRDAGGGRAGGGGEGARRAVPRGRAAPVGEPA
jgi:glutamate/tyrosine decarboxylase-like PLP-dependent enzyme